MKTKHYREVRCEDRLPKKIGWFLTNEGIKYFHGNNWFLLPPTSDGTDWKFNYVAGIIFWLEEYSPEEEARERYKKAPHVLLPTLDELPQKTARLIIQEIKIASGINTENF